MRSKNAILNIIFSLLSQFVAIIYGFIIPQIIINLFGSDVNGLISSITQFLSYITLLESGIGPIILAKLYKPIFNNNNKTIANILNQSEIFFKKIAIIFIGYSILLAFIYPLIVSKEFGYIYTLSLIIIIAISTFAEYYFGMTYRLYLQAQQKFYIISIIQIITYTLTILAMFLMSKLNFSVHAIKLICGLIFILRPIIQNLYVKKKYNINFSNIDKNYKLKDKWVGLAQHIASVIHNNTDVTILTIFCNLTEVSIYSIYYLVLTGIKLLVQAFVNGFESIFGSIIANSEYENLRKKFNMYEVIYNLISTICYSCTIILIVPFVKVYTLNIDDANYIRPLFGCLLTISEFIWAIRQPYNSLIKAAGHFKETQKGAWVEAITNILISIILVNKYGIVGVAIGTIIAMLIRTIEFIYHTNKYILKRNQFESIKKIILIVIETIMIVFLSRYLPNIEVISYITWIEYAILVFILSLIIVIPINIILFRNEFNTFINIVKNIFRKKAK